MVAIAAVGTNAVGRRLVEAAGTQGAEEVLTALALGLAGMVLGLFLVVYLFVIRRASRIARVARRLAEGDFSVRLPEGGGPPGRDVLYNFARDFDRTTRVLDARAWEVAEAEERYRAMVERIPAVAYTSEPHIDGRWHYVAPQIEEMLGYTAAEWRRDPGLWFRLIHPDDRPRVAEETGRRAREGHVSMDYRLIARDGRTVWVHDDAVLTKDPSGKSQQVQGVLFDITERKHAEDAAHQAFDREREALERLRSVDEMKNAFLSAVSHELRTPLSSVLGYGITLSQEDIQVSDEDRRDMMGRLVTNARRLETLLSDLLDLDRMARGTLEPKRSSTDITPLAQRVVEQVEVAGRPVRLRVDPVAAEVDGPKVERILENLITNAAKHTPKDGSISVTIRGMERGLLLTVEDEGPGVPDELKEVVFRPFERGPNAPTHAPGTGIGLSIVARFAELHGGRAWVEDRPGRGARFQVLLPARVTQIPAGARVPTP